MARPQRRGGAFWMRTICSSKRMPWRTSSGLIRRRAICCWLVDRWVELVLRSQPEEEPEPSVMESPRAVNSPQALDRKSAAS